MKAALLVILLAVVSFLPGSVFPFSVSSRAVVHGVFDRHGQPPTKNDATLSPNKAPVGATASGYRPGEVVTISLQEPGHVMQLLATATADANGDISASFVVPNGLRAPQSYQVIFQGARSERAIVPFHILASAPGNGTTTATPTAIRGATWGDEGKGMTNAALTAHIQQHVGVAFAQRRHPTRPALGL